MTTSSIGTSSRTYSTLQAWANACPANITAGGTNEIWKGECYNDSEFLISTGDYLLQVPAVTSDSTHYLHLTTAAGQSFKDNGGASTLPLSYDQSKGVGFRTTSHYSHAIHTTNTGTYMTVEGIQLQTTSGYDTLAGRLIVKDCIIEWDKNVALWDANGPTGDFINCVLVSRASSFSTTVLSGPGRAYNCTVVRPSDLTAGGVAFDAYFSYPLVKNCAIFGFTTMFGSTLASYPSGTDYNASSVATSSMPGSNNQGSLTYSSQFENVNNATRDWRPKSGGSLANGTRDQTNTNDLDIIGAARSTTTPTIGAREFASGGGTVQDLAGTAAAAASAAAQLAITKAMGGAATGGGTATAELLLLKSLLAAAGGQATALGDLGLAKLLAGAAAGGALAAGQLAGGATITTAPLKNNTGTVLASESGATVHVYTTAGALVVTKTGQTTNGSGVMAIVDALLNAGTDYRVVFVLASGAEGMETLTAA